MAVDRAQMKGYIAEIMKGEELEELSAKKVREQVEQKMSRWSAGASLTRC